MKKAFVRFGLFPASFSWVLLSAAIAAEEPTVRIAILQEVPSVRVTVLAPCRATDFSTGKLIGQWPNLKWQGVEAGNPGLKIGPIQTESQTVLLETTNDSILRIDARPYRGDLIFTRTPAGRLTVINRLGLEEYLVGALASEVSSDWPMEALKAHAVVSRTMVAHRVWIQKGSPFDVTADTATHLYYGVASERQRTKEAVEATRGQVLAYEGELLSATFHANCGGHTEDASELWQVKGDPAPLKGRADPYCRGLKHFRWQADLSSTAFINALGKTAEGIGDFKECEILERNASGRVRAIRIRGAGGSALFSGRDFRKLLGSNRLRSLNFTVNRSGRRVMFDGFGWGHGVGLCQWGAYGMARRGKTMDEILSFYFPSAKPRNLKGLPGFVSSN
ncbi:MAG: SpoIID/LytB domain-containing protein [Candidatus Omnitrophica bacterium]|nr:SpoIID/LytB domain-containing protein [Candidatus Omnitrophota bacterium]